MDIISSFIWGFAVVRLLVVFYNWICRPYHPVYASPVSISSLSVLIPARNEEKTLPLLLNDLKNLPEQPYEIIIYNDLSTDNTVPVVRDIISSYPLVKLFHGDELPAGWMGKNYACYQLAKRARGEYILFLDADVRIKKGLLENSLTYLQEKKLHLLSIFPRQELYGYGVWLSVPLMNWILTTLLPLSFVRLLPFTSFTAANGQCMLFENETYQDLQPHLQVRTNPVEDMAIMKLYKQTRHKVAVLLGKKDISCHMYTNLKDSIHGFSRNIFQFFGGSAVLAFLFALVTTAGPFYLLWKEGWTPLVIYLLIIVLIRLFFSLVSRQPPLINIIGCIPQQVIFWIILVKAFTGRKQNNITWKERNISVIS